MSLAVYLLWHVVTFAPLFFLQHPFFQFVRKTPPHIAPCVLIC